MSRILTIAHLTLIEAYRRKIVPAALLCSALFLLVYGTALYFINLNIPASPQRQFQLQFFTLAGLYVANFLAIAAAVLLPVDTLSGEIDSGVMQTLASKPVRRAEIVAAGEMLAGGAQHDHPHVAIVYRLCKRGVELFQQPSALRIANTRSIGGDSRHMTFDRVLDVGEMHGISPFRAHSEPIQSLSLIHI